MSKLTEMNWAELHYPAFILLPGGTHAVNLGQKLDPRHKKGLRMVFNEDEKDLYVFYQGGFARVPKASVASMVPAEVPKWAEKLARGLPFQVNDPIPFDTAQRKADNAQAETPAGPIEAQAETPTSHVFGGPGKGQTGRGGKVKA